MDWDGTTSLARAGWAGIMTGVYVENLPRLPGEDDATRRVFALDELSKLNGRPSIHQMAHLAGLIRQRGGRPSEADDYQAEFQQRLGAATQARLQKLRQGGCSSDDLLVPGVRAFMQALRTCGIGITLASGTPLDQVEEEANLLGVAGYFDSIHAPHDLQDRNFSKRHVIAGILDRQRMEGAALLAFGDGPVELAETKAVGGVAVAVASDEEEHSSGHCDPFKRESLLAAGADAVIPDFRDAHAILAAILGP